MKILVFCYAPWLFVGHCPLQFKGASTLQGEHRVICPILENSHIRLKKVVASTDRLLYRSQV